MLLQYFCVCRLPVPACYAPPAALRTCTRVEPFDAALYHRTPCLLPPRLRFHSGIRIFLLLDQLMILRLGFPRFSYRRLRAGGMPRSATHRAPPPPVLHTGAVTG